MNKLRKTALLLLVLTCLLQAVQFPASAAGDTPAVSMAELHPEQYGFRLIRSQETGSGQLYQLEHTKSGAAVAYLDNGSKRLEFSFGFRTPPEDNKGANHVLEHSLLCGSQKYPTKNLMSYLRANSVAELINAFTADDCTYYAFKTKNQKDFYNLMDVYLSSVLHPLILEDENIFKQQGIRREYADGKVQYNGVVYNELRLRNLDSDESALYTTSDLLYQSLYGNTRPTLNSGGTPEAILDLTYEDVLRVYRTYYTPSNSILYLAGDQDMSRTLALFDQYLQGFERQEVQVSWEDTLQMPETRLITQDVTEETQTVDIGFMTAGCAVYDRIACHANSVVTAMIDQELRKRWPTIYTTGGGTGGIFNTSLIISNVPIDQKDEVIAAYHQTAEALAQALPPQEELNQAIDSTFSWTAESADMLTESGILDGFVYRNDPFSMLDYQSGIQALKEQPQYLTELLNQFYVDSPYQVTAVVGHRQKDTEAGFLSVTPEELEQIRKDTEAFWAWADTPDPQTVIDAIPALDLEDFRADPHSDYPVPESAGGALCYPTIDEAAEQNWINLFFPLSGTEADLDSLTLLQGYLSYQLQEQGISNRSVYLNAFGQYHNTEQIRPHLSLYVRAEKEQSLAAETARALEWLRDEELITEDRLAAYIKEAADNVKNAYFDPYCLSYELKVSGQTMQDRFNYRTAGCLGQGSPQFYQYLLKAGAAPELNGARTDALRTLLSQILVSGGLTLEYTGTQAGWTDWKASADLLLGSLEPGTASADFRLPAGCSSAATISPGQDVNHIMLNGILSEAGQTFSGKMLALGRVVSNKYLMPTLRGKYGAYGAGLNCTREGFTFSVTGIHDLDLALSVWRGTGDFLRELDMSQKELDGIIITALKEEDEYSDAGSGGQRSLSGKSDEDVKRTREELLSTTVADLRSYADLLDQLTAQNHLFAVVSRETAEAASFPFAYFADADSLQVTPRLSKSAAGYITGGTDGLFHPDAPLTRGEAAAVFSRLLIDPRPAERRDAFPDVAPDAWYAEAVNSLTEKQILSGDDGGLFHPDAPISRAEFAALTARFIYDKTAENPADFSDLSPDHWAAGAVAVMAEKGYLSGREDGRFCPEDPVTRAEAVTILNRLLGKQADAGTASPFPDVTPEHWAYGEILTSLSAAETD